MPNSRDGPERIVKEQRVFVWRFLKKKKLQMLNFDSNVFSIMSIVIFFCLELSCIGDSVSSVWRLFYDVRMSAVLSKLEKIHETLIRLNVVTPMEIQINWLVASGVFVHFIGQIARQIRLTIKYFAFIAIKNMVNMNQFLSLKHIVDGLE